MDYSNMCDGHMVKLAKSGDTLAQEAVMVRYKNLVRKNARAFFIMGADYEDIVQEGMFGLFKAMMDFEPEKGVPFSSYAGVCITRRIINAYKSAAGKKHAPLNDYISLDLESDSFTGNHAGLYEKSPEESFILKENGKMLVDGIYSVLSGFETRVLGLYLEGRSYAQIAGELLKNEKAIDNAIQRIRRKADKVLKESLMA